MDTLNISFEQILNRKDNAAESLADEVIVYDVEYLAGRRLPSNDTAPIRIDAIIFFLCEHGEISVTIDYQPQTLTTGALLILDNRHILDCIRASDDCKGCALIVSQKLIQTIIDEVQTIKKMVMNNRAKPILMLEGDEIGHFSDSIERVKKNLKATDHAFQYHVIKNDVSSILLDAANIHLRRLRTEGRNSPFKENHKEKMVQNFLRLILEHCKEQHEVSFYAKELCMTPGNLSRIMKTASGKTAIRWISSALVAEAKILLRKPGVSIQQVSEELHFGDQSSFGKFFKKHTGLTPVEYKISIQEKV